MGQIDETIASHLTALKIEGKTPKTIESYAGSVRSQGADAAVSRCRPPCAAANSEISERQRARKSRRCSASET